MRVFFAFPFSQFCDADNVLDVKVKSFLEATRNELLQQGHEFFLAHYREGWGEKLMPPSVCTPLDYIEMCEADILLAFPGAPISGGVHIELGWASAMKKKIILFLQRGQSYSPLIHGLPEITDVTFVWYDSLTRSSIDLDSILKLCGNEMKKSTTKP